MEQGCSQCNVYNMRQSQAPYKMLDAPKHVENAKPAFMYLVDLNQQYCEIACKNVTERAKDQYEGVSLSPIVMSCGWSIMKDVSFFMM